MAVLEGDLDPTNVLLVLSALFGSIALFFFGFQVNNLGLFAAGLVFSIIIGVGLFLTNSKILNSPLPFYYTALGYIVGKVALLIPGFVTNTNFSVLATPSQSYLSAALGETSVSVTAMMNNFLAPRAENVALISLAFILLLTARQVTDSKFLQAFISVAPTSITFALLHGVRSTTFAIFAIIFMTLWIILVLGDEFGIPNAATYGLGGLGLTIGLHESNNIASSGGIFEYYGAILGASPPVIYVSYLIILIDVILLGYVVFKTVDILLDDGFSGFEFGG